MSAVIPNISKLSPRIIRILGLNPGPMTLQGTNTYLIGTGAKRILLDAGNSNYPEYIKNLENVLNENKATLQTILVTHWHADHVGGVDDILARIKPDKTCKICKIPRAEIADEPLAGGTVDYTFINGGETFETEGATLQIIHTPGHTTDHFVVVLKEENALFSGDCILGEGTSVFEDLYTYMKSLDTILKLAPSKIYPGHGPVIDDPQERIQVYIEHRLKREREILHILRKNADRAISVEELVNAIYTSTPTRLFKAAAFNVDHHLSKLAKEDQVEKVGEKWKLKDGSKL